MRIVFMGTPEFSVPTLERIVSEGHDVVAVYTRAPKPAGRRGLQIQETPVHRAAEAAKIPVYTPRTLKDSKSEEDFRRQAADLVVVIAYGLLLPKLILEAPKFGCVNLHASLLPRWRGAAPIQRAIMAGDHETGVDLMRMEEGLDTGPIAMREIVKISPQDTAGDLATRMAAIAANLAAVGIHALERGMLTFRDQAAAGISYAHKIDKSEAEIDWSRTAVEVRNQIHGLSPTPGAFSALSFGGRSERIKIYRAECAEGHGLPGAVLRNDMIVACGSGAIRIVEGQRAGRMPAPGRELLGGSIPNGAVFTPSGKTSIASQALT